LRRCPEQTIEFSFLISSAFFITASRRFNFRVATLRIQPIQTLAAPELALAQTKQN
jgi:hypothetical protein